jgi:hypothetical protein
MISAAVTTIINLIPTNGMSTSVSPFTSDELEKIKAELIAFIKDVKDNIMVDKLYLLHIFKVFNPNTKGGPQYSFSLQHGQVALNDVSMELYGVNKRGSKLCNILCKSPPVSTTMNNSMFFSDGMLSHMRNCHISYGKLCGDGVTIFAAKKAQFMPGEGYTALISFDEFCCLRAVYAGIIVAYQQRPSAIAGSGFGWLVGNRTHGIFQCGNIKLSKEAVAAKQKEEGDRAEAAKVAAEAEALNVSANALIAIIFNIFDNQTDADAFIEEFLLIIDDKYKRIIKDIYTALPAATPPRLKESRRAELVGKIKAAFGTSEEIYKMQTFCVNYNNILQTIRNTTAIKPGSTRGAVDTNKRTMDDLFGGLGSLEELIKTYLPPNTAIHYTASRRHIAYIMITRLFAKSSFMQNINEFVNTLFNFDFIDPPKRLADDTGEFITIGPNTKLSASYYTKIDSVKMTYFPIDRVERKLPDKDLYNNMLTIYNIFNQYNSYKDLNDDTINATQSSFKNRLRQRLVIFK